MGVSHIEPGIYLYRTLLKHLRYCRDTQDQQPVKKIRMFDKITSTSSFTKLGRTTTWVHPEIRQIYKFTNMTNKKTGKIAQLLSHFVQVLRLLGGVYIFTNFERAFARVEEANEMEDEDIIIIPASITATTATI